MLPTARRDAGLGDKDEAHGIGTRPHVPSRCRAPVSFSCTRRVSFSGLRRRRSGEFQRVQSCFPWGRSRARPLLAVARAARGASVPLRDTNCGSVRRPENTRGHGCYDSELVFSSGTRLSCRRHGSEPRASSRRPATRPRRGGNVRACLFLLSPACGSPMPDKGTVWFQSRSHIKDFDH